ncbi:hypothetical protein [Paenibacillus dendritiformis]|uniref:hypothetical protein n=1 Tax=Paenibacillus dendritiformis TaxID=130049 RepID=UPI0002D731A5|nr:hypothetical protein [Paenibacillus dendritiformis]
MSIEYVEKYTTSSLEWEEKISENQSRPHAAPFPEAEPTLPCIGLGSDPRKGMKSEA